MDQPTLDTLYSLFLAPRTVQSDFSRSNAEQMAALASQGLISTRETKTTHGRLWRITPPGINTLIAHGLL
jgi:proline dehydrogenase